MRVFCCYWSTDASDYRPCIFYCMLGPCGRFHLRNSLEQTHVVMLVCVVGVLTVGLTYDFCAALPPLAVPGGLGQAPVR